MAFGLGFDAEVATLFANLHGRGLQNYLVAGWEAFRTRKPIEFSLTYNG